MALTVDTQPFETAEEHRLDVYEAPAFRDHSGRWVIEVELDGAVLGMVDLRMLGTRMWCRSSHGGGRSGDRRATMTAAAAGTTSAMAVRLSPV